MGNEKSVYHRGSTFGVVRVRGFGTFSLRVVDVEKFMRELVGVQMIYQTDDVIEFVRSIVIESLIDVIAEEKSVLLSWQASCARYPKLPETVRTRKWKRWESAC